MKRKYNVGEPDNAVKALNVWLENVNKDKKDKKHYINNE